MADKKLILTFKKPYIFEGKEYKELDLSGLNGLTARNLELVENSFSQSENVSPLQEFQLGYCIRIASMATGQPIEFFEDLPIPDSIALKNVVTGFFYN